MNHAKGTYVPLESVSQSQYNSLLFTNLANTNKKKLYFPSLSGNRLITEAFSLKNEL